MNEKTFVKNMVYLGIALSFSVFVFLTVLRYFDMISLGDTADYVVMAVLSASGIYGVYEYRKLKRTRQIDERIPDFLRDIAEARQAGMTFTKAIVFTSKGNYGLLTDEIKRMAQQISWGSSVSDALELFAKRTETPLAKRFVSLINEASRSGGSVSDILYAASRDAREIKEVRDERRISMTSYVVVTYVAAFVFLAVVGIISGTFLPAIMESSASGMPSSTGGFMTGGATTPEAIRSIFFYAALIQGYGSGTVAGIFENGAYSSGIKHAFILVVISWVVFRFMILT